MWSIKKPKTDTGGDQVNSDFVLSAIQDGVVMADRDNIIRMFNKAASTITGWPAEEAIGLDYRNVLPMVDEKGQAVPEANHPFVRAAASGQSVRDSHAILTTRSGKPLPVSIIVSPVLDNASQPSGNLVAVLRDIAKEVEEERQRSDFISTASHEMRTPLTAIEGYLSLALNPKTAKIDENARKLLEKAQMSTTHLGNFSATCLPARKPKTAG